MVVLLLTLAILRSSAVCATSLAQSCLKVGLTSKFSAVSSAQCPILYLSVSNWWSEAYDPASCFAVFTAPYFANCFVVLHGRPADYVLWKFSIVEGRSLKFCSFIERFCYRVPSAPRHELRKRLVNDRGLAISAVCTVISCHSSPVAKYFAYSSVSSLTLCWVPFPRGICWRMFCPQLGGLVVFISLEAWWGPPSGKVRLRCTWTRALHRVDISSRHGYDLWSTRDRETSLSRPYASFVKKLNWKWANWQGWFLSMLQAMMPILLMICTTWIEMTEHGIWMKFTTSLRKLLLFTLLSLSWFNGCTRRAAYGWTACTKHCSTLFVRFGIGPRNKVYFFHNGL